MLPQDNSTILGRLQRKGLVPANTQLKAEDVINILRAYQGWNNEVLATYASLDPQATQDRALTMKMREAIDVLQHDLNKRHVLFLIGYAGHWYLGEAFRDQDNSIKFTLHDVRPQYIPSADQDPRNQQHVIRTFAATADRLGIGTTGPQFADLDDVDWNSYNCGDLVITRGLKCMGVTQRDSLLLTSRTPDELRKQVIREAIFKSDIITEDNIEFVPTQHGVAALYTQHPNYVLNQQRLNAPAPGPQQTSSSCTYADLQKIPEFNRGEIAKAIGNDKKKQEAFVKANNDMNKFIDSNIDQEGNITGFDAKFDTLTLKSGPTT